MTQQTQPLKNLFEPIQAPKISENLNQPIQAPKVSEDLKDKFASLLQLPAQKK
jgi:hypothetical protein